jgi:chorismate mutase
MSVLPLASKRSRAEQPSAVEALRAEIDDVDAKLLALLEQRQRLAGHMGTLKPLAPLKLNPAREAQVISRLAKAASPEVRAVVEPVWRELIGASLSIQQQIEVACWPGGQDELGRLTRSRFGARAEYRSAATPEAALAAAAEGSAVAVLALRPDSAWWSELLNLPELWIFEAIGGRGPLDPIALAVGRLEPDTLARGVAYRVSRGGDSEPRAVPERLLQVDHGRRLSAIRDGGSASLHREYGFVGAAAI